VGWSVRIGRESAALRREEQARRRVYEERLRVAQEVHDVVGHGLAAITMQADIALHMLPSRPEQAPIALAAIVKAGRAALDELRATLTAVREEPTPGVPGLADLVERMSGTGLEVTLAVAGTVQALPEAVDRTAYRIVQEALTNVLRHAGATRASVDIAYGREVVVTVRDDGRNALVYAPGHGIAGMAARAEALGGALAAGPDPRAASACTRAFRYRRRPHDPGAHRRVVSSFAQRPPGIAALHPRLGSLTSREREIVTLVAEGLTNDEIADRLVISPATARTHVSRAMVKLGARDRAQLVVFAYQSGLGYVP
jgi:DNA-binding NarL/FixJ family response regulator